MEFSRKKRVRLAPAFLSLSSRNPLELRHLNESTTLSIAVPRGDRSDGLPAGAARKALLLPRVNLFIADDGGLGKTIEAGLILRELLIRQKVRRVLVAAPPSMLLQWRNEFESRFGLLFEMI